jgi:hypothetical protein
MLHCDFLAFAEALKHHSSFEHPSAFVRRFVSVRPKRGRVCSSAAPSLATMAKKDLAFA